MIAEEGGATAGELDRRVDQKPRSEANYAIRSIGRAITVLQALNRRPESTLHELHRETGLPKPSIVRLLRTLEARGLAAPSAGYGTYQLLGRIKTLSCGFHHEPRIIEAAEEIMIDFTKREGWPLMLGCFDIDAIVVRACTIPHTSLWLDQSSLNRRLSLVSHALGRAYLANSPTHEQKILLEILKHSEDPSDAAIQNDEQIKQMIEMVRADGYAMCDPMAEQKSSSVAVPVWDHDRIVACLGLTWITAAMPLHKAIAQHVPLAIQTAEEISRKLTPDWRGPGRLSAADLGKSESFQEGNALRQP